MGLRYCYPDIGESSGIENGKCNGNWDDIGMICSNMKFSLWLQYYKQVHTAWCPLLISQDPRARYKIGHARCP